MKHRVVLAAALAAAVVVATPISHLAPALGACVEQYQHAVLHARSIPTNLSGARIYMWIRSYSFVNDPDNYQLGGRLWVGTDNAQSLDAFVEVGRNPKYVPSNLNGDTFYAYHVTAGGAEGWYRVTSAKPVMDSQAVLSSYYQWPGGYRAQVTDGGKTEWIGFGGHTTSTRSFDAGLESTNSCNSLNRTYVGDTHVQQANGTWVNNSYGSLVVQPPAAATQIAGCNMPRSYRFWINSSTSTSLCQ